MRQTVTQQKPALDRQLANEVSGGLAVRTNLRAGLAWDDLDDQTKAAWDKLINTVSALTASDDITTNSA